MTKLECTDQDGRESCIVYRAPVATHSFTGYCERTYGGRGTQPIRKHRCTEPNTTVDHQCTRCECAPGYGKYPNKNDCVLCGINHYLNTTGRDSVCLPCPQGRVSEVEGAVECRECNAQEVLNKAQNICLCRAGYGVSGKDQTCRRCPPGAYHAENHNAQSKEQCVQCEPGSVPNQNQSGCVLCAADSEITNLSQTACICANGYGIVGDGQVCQQCQAGTFNTADTSGDTKTECKQCPANTVSATAGATQCSATCGDSETPNSAKTTCVCRAGYGKDTSGTCVACTGNTVSAGEQEEADSQICIPCGQYQIANALHTQCLCKAGYGVISNVCAMCEAGTFSRPDPASESKTICSKCPQGLCSKAGASECYQCDRKENANKEEIETVNITQGLSVGVIIGILVSFMVGGALIAGIVTAVRKRRRKPVVAALAATQELIGSKVMFKSNSDFCKYSGLIDEL